MLHIITGPDSSRSSQTLIRRLVTESRRSPGDNFIAIVPEQSTLQMQRAVVEAHPVHAVMNIDIVSFDRLAHNVFEEIGFSAHSVLNDTGKVLILRKVLEECRDDLVMYRKKVRMPGFTEQIKSSITELKQYALDDNDLYLMQESAQREGNQVLFSKLQDIRLIYRKFNDAIEEAYTTQEEILAVLARLAGQSQMLKGAHIYLDGYTGFTPIQYRLMEELLRHAADMTVTVTIPLDPGLYEGVLSDLFALSRQTLEKLQTIAGKLEIPCELLPGSSEVPKPEKAWQYEASDPRSEITWIAGKILEGVRAGKMRYRDYAVVLSDMDGYHRIVEEVLEEAGIPFFIDHKKKLSDNVLARFLIAALTAVLGRFSFDSIFACLKTGMSGVPRSEIHELENYCLAFGIREASAWKKEFAKNRRRRRGMSDKDGQEYWDLTRINQTRSKAAEPLLAFYDACSGNDHTAASYCDALLELLVRTKAEERMQAYSEQFYEAGDSSRGKEYEQIYGQITQLLQQIRNLMGGEVISLREYMDILSGAMDEVKVSIIPPTLDAVPVGDLIRSRMEQPGTLFLAGANEGKVPSRSAGAGLLTAQERTFLKNEQFELAPDALESLYTQYFYLYLLFTRPAKELLISWARRNPDGEEQLPSNILDSAGDILPGLLLEPAQDPEGMLWAGNAADHLARVIRSELDETQQSGADGQREEKLVWRSEDQKLLRYFAENRQPELDQILAGAFFTNRALDLDEQTVLDLYGGVLAGSVSRYERFYECPFRHFLDYGISLQKRMEFQMEAADIGTVYHESLERYGLKLKERGKTFRNVSDQESDEIVREVVEEAAAQMPGDILRSSERNRFLLERMEEITRKTADVLRLQVRQGLYDPAHFEMEFAGGQKDQAVLRGKIDRVDIYEEGDIFVKIIDYKSGKKEFSIRDIYSGLQLQLTAYLQAAIQEVQKSRPDRTVRPGGVYYYLVQDRYVDDEEKARLKYQMSGLTNCDKQTLHAIDTETGMDEKSPIVDIRYSKSGLSSTSKVANDEEFARLMGFVEERIMQAARDIRAGDVSIRPFCDGTHDACKYCDYRDVCKFEPGRWGCEERKLPPEMTDKDIEAELYGRPVPEKGAKKSR